MSGRPTVVGALLLVFCAVGLEAQVPRTGASTTNVCSAGITICDLNWAASWYTLSGFGAATGSLAGSIARAALVTSTPSPPWAPNIPGTQQWIGGANNGSVGGGINRYYFQTTFTSNVSTTLGFGLGWDNRLVGAYVGGGVQSNGSFSGGISLLGGTSPSSPYASAKAGFCRDGDGVFPSSQYPNCVLNVAIAVNALQANTLTFVVEGDGTTDGFLLGNPFGELPPPTVVPPPSTSVPEPSTYALMAVGLVALAATKRRRVRV